MTSLKRVVYDCNVFLQALAAPEGPAGRCVQLAFSGQVSLFISPVVLEELREVTSRPKVISKLRLVDSRVQNFFQTIEIAATLIEGFPEPFTYQRDSDDAHYVNLAIAASAKLIVSRDKDLLDLMDASKTDAASFQRSWPTLRILEPVGFLRLLDSRDASE